MKKHAVLCTDPDGRLMAAFGLAMSGLPSPRFRTWQVLLARRPDLLDRTMAELQFCEHAQWIRATPPRPPALHLGRGGRRRCLMSWDEETRLISELEARARKGERISVDDIVAEIAVRTGKRTTRQTIHDLLRRQGWVRVGVKPMWERLAEKERRRRTREREDEERVRQFGRCVGVDPVGGARSDGAEHEPQEHAEKQDDQRQRRPRAPSSPIGSLN